MGWELNPLPPVPALQSILTAEVTHSKLILIPFTFALHRAPEHVDLRYRHWQWLDFLQHFMNIIGEERTSL
jgi:hypothetical protein